MFVVVWFLFVWWLGSGFAFAGFTVVNVGGL